MAGVVHAQQDEFAGCGGEEVQRAEVLLNPPEGRVVQAQDFADQQLADHAVGDDGDGALRVAGA